MHIPRLIFAAFAVAACLVLGGCDLRQPDPAEKSFREAARLLGAGRFPEASVRIDQALKASPAHIDTYLRAIRLLASHERYREAGAVGDTAVRRAEQGHLERRLSRDELAGLYLLVGHMHQQARSIEAAEANYRRALQLAPDSALALNALAWLYADEGIKLDAALRLARRAVALAPNEAAIVDTLGWALYKLRRVDEAVQVLRRAVELDPNHPELRYHLGAALARAGRTTEAWVELNKALILDPELTAAYHMLNRLQLSAPRQRLRILY